MKILWAKAGGLWPVDRGGRRRSFEIVRALAARHELTVMTTHDPELEPHAGGEAARALGCEVVSVPWRVPKHGSAGFAAALAGSWLSELPVDLWRWRAPALASAIARRLAKQDAEVCVADFLAAAPNVPLEGAVPVVLFAHNVEHQIWRRLADAETRPLRRALLAAEWRKMRRYEAEVVRRVRRTIAVSDGDRALLAAAAPAAEVVAIPTGVDASYFRPNGAGGEGNALVFVGAMDWYPNEDAVRWFAEAILPRIRSELPDATLTVVGRSPGAALRALDGGVRVTGTVADVRPYVDEAALVVVPLRIGGGTRLKILEALAMGKAVVATSVGVEGLPLAAGEHFVRADAPEELARAVVDLLRDRPRRCALGESGRRLVVAEHGWEAVAQVFEQQLQQLTANG